MLSDISLNGQWVSMIECDTTEPISKFIGPVEPIKYKCPNFPYCKVATPFEIRLSTPKDMEHFMKYHD